jgi:hypothetical protein
VVVLERWAVHQARRPVDAPARAAPPTCEATRAVTLPKGPKGRHFIISEVPLSPTCEATRAVTLPNIGVPHFIGVPQYIGVPHHIGGSHRVTYPNHPAAGRRADPRDGRSAAARAILSGDVFQPKGLSPRSLNFGKYC